MKITNLAITAILFILGLGMIHSLTSSTGAIVITPTPYCDYSLGVSIVECGCGRMTVRTGRIAQRIEYKRGRLLVLEGDHCPQHREICWQACRTSAFTLLQVDSIGTSKGYARIISVDGRKNN